MAAIVLPEPVASWIRARGLDPGVGKVPHAVMAEEDHAAHGRRRLPLVVAHEPQGLQIVAAEGAERCERLGSRSEVEVFRAEARQGLLVETFPPGETAHAPHYNSASCLSSEYKFPTLAILIFIGHIQGVAAVCDRESCCSFDYGRRKHLEF